MSEHDLHRLADDGCPQHAIEEDTCTHPRWVEEYYGHRCAFCREFINALPDLLADRETLLSEVRLLLHDNGG